MTATTDTTIPTAVQAAKARIDTAIDALLALLNLAAELPDIADRIIIGEHGSMRLNIYVGNELYANTPVPNAADATARIVRIAKACERHGATLTTCSRSNFGGVLAKFGPFELYVYADVNQVGAAQVREVTEWQLDERLTAFGTEASK